MSRKYVVLKLIGRRVVDGTVFFRVVWDGHPEEEATWEPEDVLVDDCPHRVEEYMSQAAEKSSASARRPKRRRISALERRIAHEDTERGDVSEDLALKDEETEDAVELESWDTSGEMWHSVKAVRHTSKGLEYEVEFIDEKSKNTEKRWIESSAARRIHPVSLLDFLESRVRFRDSASSSQSSATPPAGPAESTHGKDSSHS